MDDTVLIEMLAACEALKADDPEAVGDVRMTSGKHPVNEVGEQGRCGHDAADCSQHERNQGPAMTIVCHGWSLRGFPVVAPNLFAAHAHANFTRVGPANARQLSDTPPTGSSFAISATGGRHSETLARTASSTLCPDGRTPKAAQAPPSITVLPSTNTLNSPYFPFSISTSVCSSRRIRAATRTACRPETQYAQ